MNVSLSLIVAVLAAIGNVAPVPGEILTECPSTDLVDRTVHLPHEYDCTKFYKCSNGQKFEQDCPPYDGDRRLYYDPDLQVCGFPWSVICWVQRSECGTNVFLQSHPYNCDLYYKCENGRRILKACGNGEQFDFWLKACVPEEKARCNVYVHQCPPREIHPGVRLPHECECSKYYECVRGEPVKRHCSVGLHFDIGARVCVPAEQAVCSNGTDHSSAANRCPASGIKNIPHETDCSMYYECTNGAKSEKKCDYGLSFDEAKGMCSWPPSSDCASRSRQHSRPILSADLRPEDIDQTYRCPPNGSKTVERLPHHCSCTKYYSCADGEMTVEECPRGMEFDYVRQVCDYSGDAVCKHREAKAPKALFVSVLSAARECSPRGNERLPHESNCRLYYQCRKGKKNLQSCYEGHYFNEIIEACDIPINTNCLDGPTSPPPVTPTDGAEDCPTSADCKGIVRFPDANDCSRYYACENGRKVAKQCPKDLRYDPVEQICDWPENVNCAPKDSCTEGERNHHECQCELYYECRNGSETVQSCRDGKHFDYRRKVCDLKENVVCLPGNGTANQCIGSCSPGDPSGTLPHQDCRKYCECSNGDSRVVQCPRNQFYDPEKRKCGWPEKVANLTCEPFPCDSDTAGQKLPHECHCDRYYVCTNNMKIRENCEDGLHFDYEKQTCVDPAIAHCYADKSVKESDDAKKCGDTCSTRNTTDPFVHEDCKKYCRCSDGQRLVYECPEGLYYDEVRQRCDWPENAKKLKCDPFECTPDGSWVKVLPHECDCKLFYTCSNGTKFRGSCEDGDNFDYVEQACVKSGTAHCYRKPSASKDVEAEGCRDACPRADSTDGDVRLPHDDCSKFCVCHAGAAYVVTCPDDLHYDQVRQICTSPDAAGCRGWHGH